MMTLLTTKLIAPEFWLVIAGTLIFMLGAFKKLNAATAAGLGLACLAIASFLLCSVQGSPEGVAAWTTAAAKGPLVVDPFSFAVRWVVLLVGALLVLLSASGDARGFASEYVGSLVLIIAGSMLLATANELVLIFLALELISIPTYVVLYLGRGDAQGQEATIKYFFLSILSSALLLYGFSFLYGAAGSTNLADLHAKLTAQGSTAPALTTILPVALILIFAGMGFRLTAVPFHFYAPDVYQGTSQANAALLSTLPKFAGLVGLARIVAAAMPGMEPLGWKVALVLSVLTMTLGNILALWQDNVRRLLAYSSIANAGYMLIGVAVALGVASEPSGATAGFGLTGIGSALFYVLIYSVATIGVFAALVYLGREDRQIEGVDELAGLSNTHFSIALAIAVFMFSLTGIPWFAGFFGKFGLFSAALGVGAQSSSLHRWFVALTIVAALNAAISGAYYLRIVAIMFFRPALISPRAKGGTAAALTIVICVVLSGLVIPGAVGPLLNKINAAGNITEVKPEAIPAKTASAATPPKIAVTATTAAKDTATSDTVAKAGF